MKHYTNRLLILQALVFCSLFCYAQTTIQLEKEGGVYKVPCVVNGLKLKLIFDTGASNVCISQSVAIMMLENDYLSVDDIKGTSHSKVADGRIVDHTIINLKRIQIGDKLLTDVEAIVIHGQTAPLLLGQSALKKLGRYSISGDKLILGTSFNSIHQTIPTELSDDAIERIFQEANESYDEEAYSVALEKFRILFDNDLLSDYGKMQYADCFFYTDKKEEALVIYYSIQQGIELDFPSCKVDLYFQIGRCLWGLEDYDAAIPYFEKVKLHSTPWSYYQTAAVKDLSYIYDSKGDTYRSRRILEDYIKQYLSFMEINSTDCWDKLYVDEYLADLYYCRWTKSSSSSSDVDKYIIIAAAWGSKDAIEYCKKQRIDYSSKPYKYEY